MLEHYIIPGQKIELYQIDRVADHEPQKPRKVYFSKIYDVTDEERIEILMPIEQSKLILLPVGGEYKVVFFTKQGLYQCCTRVVERYKNNKLYLLSLEITSSMKKYQRREYYRFNCVIPLKNRPLTEEERANMKADTKVAGSEGSIVDISGGGLRFISEENYEKEDLVFCQFFLKIKGSNKRYDTIGKVLGTSAIENQPEKREVRACFEHMSDRSREEIIQFIFEEERRQRKKEQGR